MDIPVELSKVVIDEASEQQFIVLKEKNGSRVLPIVIGVFEIMAIERRLKGKIPPRPLTHDLTANIIERLGAKIEKIVISDLKDGAYFATIHLAVGEDKIEIDARPSDAVAIGIATNVPLFAKEKLLGS